VQRGILGGHDGIFRDYFADPCIYNNKPFRRRFRMSKSLFLRIVAAVESHDDYFRQKPNAVGALGASPIQKSIAAVRMLAYGVSADFLDDYVRLGESTIIECLKHFVKAVVEVFSEQYLRPPMPRTQLDLWPLITQEGGQACLAPLTVCTGSGTSA